MLTWSSLGRWQNQILTLCCRGRDRTAARFHSIVVPHCDGKAGLCGEGGTVETNQPRSGYIRSSKEDPHKVHHDSHPKAHPSPPWGGNRNLSAFLRRENNDSRKSKCQFFNSFAYTLILRLFLKIQTKPDFCASAEISGSGDLFCKPLIINAISFCSRKVLTKIARF